MKKFSLLFGLTALLMLCACNQASFITPDKSQIDFIVEGGEQTVTVSTDGSWDIRECPGWLSTEVKIINKESWLVRFGMKIRTEVLLKIKATSNESGNSREGEIVLASGDATATITVTQASNDANQGSSNSTQNSDTPTQNTKCTHITPETNTLSFGIEGGRKTVNINTDGTPRVNVTGGFTATFEGGVLTVTAPPNDGGKRNGKITLTDEAQTATIKVTQSGSTCITCGGTGKMKCARCGGSGVITVSDGYYIEYYGCTICGGRGYEGESGNNMVKGSGRVRCSVCGGKGH